MNRSVLALAIAFAIAVPPAAAQLNSSSTGGAGGAGGVAAGGQATGGAATNSNTTSGVSNASGGLGGSAHGGSGGTASASGGSVGTVSTGGSQASLGDVTVNWNTGSAPMGKDGLGVGVDPTTGHIVTDNLVKYGGSYKVKSNPDIGIGGPASGPCNGFSAAIGLSVAGFGIGGNTSTVDEGCTARETARVAAMLGRMDIANAVLESLPAVQAALRAKAEREAMPRADAPGLAPATVSPVREDPRIRALQETAENALRELDQVKREAALKEQQELAREALTRQATMAKLNDTLKFTDATTQAQEKTPQQIMAEEAAQKLKPVVQQSAAKVPQTDQPLEAQQAAGRVQQPDQLAAGRQVASNEQEVTHKPPTTTMPLPAQPTIPPATTYPLQPQQFVQPQLMSSAHQAVNLTSERPNSEMRGGGKAAERAPPLSTEDRIKVARMALNLK